LVRSNIATFFNIIIMSTSSRNNDSHYHDDHHVIAIAEEPPVRTELRFAEAVVIANDDAAKKRRMKIITQFILLISLAFFTVATVAWTTARRSRNRSNKNAQTSGTSTSSTGPGTAIKLTTTMSPTNSPTTQAIPKIANTLRPYVSSWDDLTSPGTPQNAALFWLALEDTTYRAAATTTTTSAGPEDDVRFLQRFVLAVIYYSLGGDLWRSCHRNDPVCSTDGTKQSWLTDTDECSWNMIECDDQGHIVAFVADVAERCIAEWDKVVVGMIPPEMAHLTFLQVFQLYDHRIGGPLLTYLTGMSNLTILNIHDSDFTGTIPFDFAATHPLLTEIDVNNNALTGTIPALLTGWSNVKVLDLSNNALVGSIPSTIGSMAALTKLSLGNNMAVSLTKLSLGNNTLTGDIPLEIYNLTNLIRLDLGDNSLGGTMASEIGNLSNLTEVTLGPSIMTGSLPTQLFDLTALEILQLHDSQFTGPLRDDDFAKLADTITVLRLENNDFTGSIPIAAWESVTVLETLYVDGNPQLTGSVTQTLCAKRGNFVPDIQYMKMGCNILCIPGCCGDIGCDSVWVTSRSELPP
jgi:Leucine rich repeat